LARSNEARIQGGARGGATPIENSGAIPPTAERKTTAGRKPPSQKLEGEGGVSWRFHSHSMAIEFWLLVGAGLTLLLLNLKPHLPWCGFQFFQTHSVAAD
jgi:hypothetical protein